MGNDVSKINVNPSNYIQGNNQMNNYSNSRNGNLMQVNNSVSTADTSGLQARSTQVEELDFNIETTTTNTSNIPIPENNSMAQIEMLEQTIAKSLENLEQQEKYLRESYNKFANAPQNSYPGLYFDGNRYLNPSEYAAVYYSRYNSYTYGISPNNSNTSGYAAINGAKNVADSTVNLISIEEYTKRFNEYFEKTVGYDYNQYQNNLNLINQELTKLKASKYSIAQMKKQQPYLDMLNTKEYKDYVNENANNTSFSSISLSQKEVGYYDTKHIETILVIDGVEVNPAEANLIKIAMELEKKGNTDTAEYNYIKNYMYTQRYQFLTENDKLMYSYLYDTKGKKAADDYLEAIKDDLNRREGQASAEKFIKGITDENGDIETEKLSTYLKTSVKGFLDGNDNFYDGLANISATEGMVSVNQYEQMYILQYLANSKGIYIEKILETKSPEEAQRISEGIYTADGKINHQFAKENLTEAEYLKLLEKIQQDEFGILDESYQISTSIGNMAPSMLVSATANILLPGSSFALMGSTLMGLSSGGNSLNQALIDGNDLHAARMYGLCSGLSETTVGYLLGNIPYLSKVSEFSIKGILKEGLEEGIQEFVDAGMRATILGEHIELNQLGQDALKSFIYGCVTSFIMNGGQATVEFSINGVMHRYDNINDFIDGMKPYLPDDVQSQFDNAQINDTVKQTDTSINASIDDNAIAMANYYTNKGLIQTFSFSEVANLPDINHSFWTSFDNPENILINIDGRIMTFDDAISYKMNYDLNMKDNNLTQTRATKNIEQRIDNDTLVKEEISSIFSGIIGKNLSSWIPNIESGYSLYNNLLEACNNAKIEISELKNCFNILTQMIKYYEDARVLQLEQESEIFKTYRTHGIIHIFDVLTQSINAYAAFEKSGIKNLSLKTIMLSSIMHDTGMSGGQQLKLSLDADKKLVINTSEIESNGKNYRESHSFNSGVNILNEYETLRAYGYNDLEIAEAALITFAHSKSNSGLNPLSENVNGWSFAIQALSKATQDSKFNIIDVLKNNNIIYSSPTQLSHKKIEVKCPDGKVEGYIENYNLNDEWLNTMGYEALIVRIGDALTNNDNAGTNQYGDKITFDTTNYSNQHSINEIMEHFSIDTELSQKEQFTQLKKRLAEVAGYEAEKITYEVKGIVQGGSQQFVLGENNQTYKVTNNETGDIEVIVSIKNSENIPLCTLFAIDERAGELNSKGDGLFGLDSSQKMKLIIEIDSSTTEQIKTIYQQYANFYNNIKGKVGVEIREINKLTQIQK